MVKTLTCAAEYCPASRAGPMSEFERPTRPRVELVDIDVEKPFSGQRVFALGLGGVLVPMAWYAGAEEFFYAWMAYPKTPTEVKRKLYERYMRSA